MQSITLSPRALKDLIVRMKREIKLHPQVEDAQSAAHSDGYHTYDLSGKGQIVRF